MVDRVANVILTSLAFISLSLPTSIGLGNGGGHNPKSLQSHKIIMASFQFRSAN